MRAAWASDPARSGEMPAPAEVALAQYCTHIICKMNANLGFGTHTPGLGRQPVSEGEASRYFDLLGKHLLKAVERDFDEADRKFGSLPALTPGHITHVGRVHLNGLITYQTELGNALAQANREGEEARREERMRIWGYA